jgi:cellulose synthase/poly-beta-1,6-N-acetylglucosamine synthase-like glycosyltransferase
VVHRLIPVVLFWVPVGVLFYHWVVYPLVLAVLAVSRSGARERRTSDWQPFVTIVMAAYNEEDLIAAKISNCLGLDYPAEKTEILIGSDSSTDATDSIVRSFADPRVKLIRVEPRSGKVAVQNRLLAEARGEVIMTTDVDCLLTRSSLRLMVARLDDPIVAVVSPRYARLNADGSLAEGVYDRWESRVKELEGRIGSMIGCYGYAYVMRREVACPIPDDTILDDFVLAAQPFRGGYDVVIEEGALVTTRTEAERLEFRRKVRISRGNLQALLRLGDLLNPKYGLKAWVYFSHKVLRMLAPFLLLSMLVASAVVVAQPFFAVMLALQLCFVATVPLVVIAGGKWRRVLIPQYYYYMNIALLVGYWQFFTVREKFWSRTPRASAMR